MNFADSAPAAPIARRASLVLFGAALLLPGIMGRTEVILAPPFQDHAVLQRGKTVPVWGRADPGEPVRVTFGSGVVQTTADPDGRWRVDLPALAASAVPAELVVEGVNRIVVRNVLVGEVWLCSGQSNMDFRLAKATDGAAGADFPAIRQLRVTRNPAAEPQATVAAAWTVCSPETAADFTAVGYHFARDLWQVLGVPVGIIVSAHGDTPVEAWLSAAALAGAPEFALVADRWAHPVADRGPPKPYQAPSCLYNGMIHPVVPYALRGFLWYQGESNAVRAAEYELLFPALIRQWRSDFQQGALPFFWVQLPNLGELAMPRGTTDADWVALRAAQSAALALPATGQAVALDLGDTADIHPPRKREAGERLARLARHRVYGEAIMDRGPEPAEVRAEGDAVRVRFTPAGGALDLRGEAPAAFELAGADGIFAPATAVAIDGEDLVTRAASVPRPVAIRYAWRADPVATLFNRDGLPAAPFRRSVP